MDPRPPRGVKRSDAADRRLRSARAAGALFVIALITTSALLRPSDLAAAARQDWPPFVLVAGLLLIGAVANDDGVFEAIGSELAKVAGSGLFLYLGAMGIVTVVTATLNLDTSVAFLTPVLVYTARQRGGGEAALLYGCLLLSNAASLFLPGSNLTNLIVVGAGHMSGASFLSHMWAPALVAVFVTATAVFVACHASLRQAQKPDGHARRIGFGLGVISIALATVFVIAFSAPALPVLAVGIGAVGLRLAQGRAKARDIAETLGASLLVGLFVLATALGTLGRAWSGPATLLSHLDAPMTSVVAALASVVFNNLPAASLLSARAPTHPFTLLIGLNLGPNLFVTGSLAWLLWLRSARAAGAQPSIATASRIGVCAAPIAITASLVVLIATGSS